MMHSKKWKKEFDANSAADEGHDVLNIFLDLRLHSV